MDTITLPDPAATQAFGRQLATAASAGAAFALCGDLGAGKTHLVKGLAEGLGLDPAEVTSPTFTLVHEYRGGRLPLFHFDFYRLASAAEVLDLGWDDYLAAGIVAVEWADKFPLLLPPGTRWLHINVREGTARTLSLRP